MSRHTLRPKASHPDVAGVAIGWDRPLQTFFAQVFMRTASSADEGEVVIWRGTEPGELLSAAAAIAVVAPYAEVPADFEARLTADMQATIGLRDGHQQVSAKRYLFGSTH